MNTAPRLLAGLASLALLGGLTVLTAVGEESKSFLDRLQPREVRANTYTFSSQEDSSVAVDAAGRILVTWSSRRQELGNYGVFAQLLDPLGRPLGTEIHVNAEMRGAQLDSYPVFAPDGSAWVVWSSMNRRTPQNGIFLRRLADTEEGFVPVDGELWVGGEPQHLYDDAAIAVNERGELLVAYVRKESDRMVVVGRRLASDGSPLGDPFRLGELESGQERVPDVAALPGGDYVAVWQTATDRGLPLGLRGRRIDSDGGLGATFAVNDLEESQHVEPNLAVDAAGRVLVAWMATSAESYAYQARARRFGADLQPLGASFPVGAGAGHQNGAIAVCAEDGRFLVAYNLHTGTYQDEGGRPARQCDIWAQAYGVDGAPLGESYRVNDPGPGFHAMKPSQNGNRAAWSGDHLVFSWAGAAPGDGSGVAVRILTPRGFDVEAPPPVDPLAACSDLTTFPTSDEAYPEPNPAWARNIPRVPPPTRPGSDGFVAHDATQWTPPDCDLAVGPDMIVSQVNMEIAAFTKDGTELWRQDNTSPGGFYTSLGAGDFVFDPISTYDWHSQRFVVANNEIGVSEDYVCFAVSKDSHPDDVDDWWKYRVQVSPTCDFPDFPNLGVNRDYISVTTDCFIGTGGNRVMIFEKASVMNGTLGTWKNKPMDPGLQSLGNVKNYDSNNGYLYFVSVGFSSGNSLRLQCKKFPNSQPISTNLPVSFFDVPFYAPQAGSSTQIWTIDTRIKHGVVRNGHLYCAHGIGSGGVTRVRWYEIDLGLWPDSGSPTLVQEGELDLGPGVYSWFPDICPDAQGNIALSYNRSASNEPISIEATSWMVGDPPGTMRTPIQLQVSTSPSPSDRWGDYGGVDEDPAAPGTFWSHLEFSTGSWETWIDKWVVSGSGPGSLFCSGEAGSGTPCPCGNDNDGTLPGAGCANGFFASGALLTGSGFPSVTADTLVLQAVAMEPGNSGLYFQADNDLSPGIVWGDGLRCAGGDLKRLGVRFADSTGASDTSGFAYTLSAKAANVTAGSTKYYQCWYRCPNGSPCLSDFNASNGYAVTWQP